MNSNIYYYITDIELDYTKFLKSRWSEFRFSLDFIEIERMFYKWLDKKNIIYKKYSLTPDCNIELLDYDTKTAYENYSKLYKKTVFIKFKNKVVGVIAYNSTSIKPNLDYLKEKKSKKGILLIKEADGPTSIYIAPHNSKKH